MHRIPNELVSSIFLNKILSATKFTLFQNLRCPRLACMLIEAIKVISCSPALKRCQRQLYILTARMGIVPKYSHLRCKIYWNMAVSKHSHFDQIHWNICSAKKFSQIHWNFTYPKYPNLCKTDYNAWIFTNSIHWKLCQILQSQTIESPLELCWSQNIQI